MLQSESPSSMCAKLNTVPASNNRVHTPWSLYYCLFAPLIYGCSFSRTFHSWWTAHSAQQQPRGRNNIPSFLQRTASIACSFCEGFTWHELHILVTAPFYCDRKAQTACALSFTLWQQATIEFTCRNYSIIACLCHLYMGVLFHAHSIHGELRIQRNANWEVATVSLYLKLLRNSS